MAGPAFQSVGLTRILSDVGAGSRARPADAGTGKSHFDGVWIKGQIKFPGILRKAVQLRRQPSAPPAGVPPDKRQLNEDLAPTCQREAAFQISNIATHSEGWT